MRKALFVALSAVVALAGLVCVAFPFAMLVWPGGPMLLDDTRAFLGAGTADGVPVVHQVACGERRYGGSGGRSHRTMPSLLEYECDLLFAADANAESGDPYAGLSHAEALKKYGELVAAQSRGEGAFPDRIERTFPRDMGARTPPTLRRLSADDESPIRFGVVQGSRDLALRWASWAAQGLLFWAFGGACLFAAHVGVRRARGAAAF